jgi:hypothetical protein
LFEHDLRANVSRLSRGKTGSHFSGSCLVARWVGIISAAWRVIGSCGSRADGSRADAHRDSTGHGCATINAAAINRATIGATTIDTTVINPGATNGNASSIGEGVS